MPMYEFLCQACRKRFEAFQHLEERVHRPPCPRCGSARRVEHLISSFYAKTSRKA
ncbi:MAG: zinc ribbon domain-containing protein [Deltaproteobacteria bacterium]|nr:zinc ribbon domain-containing protein [Deltaproteobacteria bacterium]